MRTRPDAVPRCGRCPSLQTLAKPFAAPRSRQLFSEAEPASRGRALLEAHFDLILRKLRRLSRRSGLPDFEAEELRSWALLKLVDDDYRALARWEGRSSFSTFLTIVLMNLMRDYRVHVWGKWRPSAAARRHGEAGVILDRLLARDGLSVGEAVERLRAEHGVSLSADQAEQLAAELPRRPGRWRVGEEELVHIPIDGRVESRIEEEERARTADRLRELLVPLLRALPAEDRLLLKLCFLEGLSVAAIAPILGRPQRELYARRERCLEKIRRSLAEAGLERGQVGALLGRFQGSLGLEAALSGQHEENAVLVRPTEQHGEGARGRLAHRFQEG
jgi:RNA polymerase sigma factor (sigma-70 family)